MLLKDWISQALGFVLPAKTAAVFATPTLILAIAVISLLSYFLCVRILTPLTHYITRLSLIHISEPTRH